MKTDPTRQRDEQPNDEINREGARRYGEGVRENARSGKSDQQAREAAKALDGPEGQVLRDAERKGKAAARRS